MRVSKISKNPHAVALGMRGFGKPKRLTAAQRAYRVKQIKYARNFRWKKEEQDS